MRSHFSSFILDLYTIQMFYNSRKLVKCFKINGMPFVFFFDCFVKRCHFRICVQKGEYVWNQNQHEIYGTKNHKAQKWPKVPLEFLVKSHKISWYGKNYTKECEKDYSDELNDDYVKKSLKKYLVTLSLPLFVLPENAKEGKGYQSK